MSDWSDGYVTNIEYTSHFYPYLAPVSQNLALLLAGLMPADIRQPFTYCELGCGQGFSTALLAAANPQGRFWGVDFNPAHVAGANKLKAAAELNNIVYLERSFAELSAAGLPEFDFIALHGVWSWINASNREAVTGFIKSNLKPGGVVYISYNAMPGWAGIAPLRQLFIESQRHKSQVDLASVDDAVALANRMRAANASFFKINPIAGVNLDGLGKMSKNYLLHEYFNQAWEPSYFSEVAAELKLAKLSFACSSDVLEHIDKLCLSDEATALINGVADPIARQTIRDYFRNSRFRRDLFARGARKLTGQERVEMLRNTRLAVSQTVPGFPLQVNFPAGSVTLTEKPHATILTKLMQGPRTLGELTDDPTLAPLGQQGVFQAVLLLAAMNRIQAALPAEGEAERRSSVERFNRAVMMQPIGLEAQTLASPVTGNGVPVTRIDQFLLGQLARGRKTSSAEFLKVLDALNLKITQAGEATAGQETPRESATKAVDSFEKERLPVYRSLGIAA